MLLIVCEHLSQKVALKNLPLAGCLLLYRLLIKDKYNVKTLIKISGTE